MALLGLRHTGQWSADQRPKNWREGILMLQEGGNAPLTGLTSAMKSRAVDDPEFNWWEKRLESYRVQLGADALIGDATITLAAGAFNFKAGDVLRVEQSNEIVRVSADPTTDTSLAVTRGFAGSTAAAMESDGTVNPYLVKIGSVYPEGSNAPSGIAYDPTKKYNYTQIFRDTLEVTNTAIKTRLRTGDQVQQAKKECFLNHTISMERAFFFGRRYEGTLESKPARMTGGLEYFVDAGNVRDQAGVALTMDKLEEYLRDIFLFGSSQKMAFTGNLALSAINATVRKNSSYNISFGEKEYGMKVSRLVCPFGELVLKTHPLFNQMRGGATYRGHESTLFVIDQANLQYVYLKDRDTKYQADLQENDLDGVKSGYLTECGLEVHHPLTHFIIKGITSGAADA